MVFIVVKCLSDDLFKMLQARACSCAALHLNVLLPPWWFFPEETKRLHSNRWRFLCKRCSPTLHLSWVAMLYCQRLLFLPPTISVHDKQSGLKSAQQCHPSGGSSYWRWLFHMEDGNDGKGQNRKSRKPRSSFSHFTIANIILKSLHLYLLCTYSTTIRTLLQWQSACSGMLS